MVGLTYRLRILNGAADWEYRLWSEKHDVTIISINGADVYPIKIPKGPYGIAMNTAERYDLLMKFDLPCEWLLFTLLYPISASSFHCSA